MIYCPINGCFQRPLAGREFCRSHWRRVPLLLRRRILSLYRSPRTRGGPTHLRALDEAIQIVPRQLHRRVAS